MKKNWTKILLRSQNRKKEFKEKKEKRREEEVNSDIQVAVPSLNQRKYQIKALKRKLKKGNNILHSNVALYLINL